MTVKQKCEEIAHQLAVEGNETAWNDVAAELDDHEPYDSEGEYWSDFLWGLRFLQGGFEYADAERERDAA